MTQPITQPDDMTDSRAQLLEMRANLMGHPRYADDPKYARLIEVAPDFEPSELSEIVDGLFITSRDGVEAAMMEGQLILRRADIHPPVRPHQHHPAEDHSLANR